MPDPFAGLELPPERTGRFIIRHPMTNEVLRGPDGDAWVELVGWHSPQAQQHRFDTELALRDSGRAMTPAEQHENMGEMLAKLVVGWHLVTLDGKPLAVDCTYPNAKALFNRLSMRWLRNGVVDFLNVEGNFPLPSRVDSQTTPATNSD